MDELSKELTVEMVPDGIWRKVAEEIGPENLCKMLSLVGGAATYIPKLESILRPIRDKHIKSEFNGWNYLELAQKYNLTDRVVREVCGPGVTEDQIGLFGD